ncbi:LppX_LprAFG lipoprotein [Nocardioides sp.]|uniref:LppX_LprAFG lipoprotein n=1 Tax=Nocardioides sp. TaxID=35761 RepID=UPI002735011C|nr:LppX_LprAFG lipoprotein [Nocardioides sp.]MDP3890164.1 LppX_LprAFG lipoprotein [Nocardioides sp.]
MTARRHPRSVLAVALVGVLLLLGACSGGGSEDDEDPTAALDAAKVRLDETSGVRIELTTPGLPDGVSGVVSATGVGTRAPAFDGEITVATSGITADVPVVSVGGEVYAKLPFTTSFDVIDPAAYQAPDPASFMDDTQGLSSLLAETSDVTVGDQVRDGSDVLTELTGTVPGAVVARIIPTADPEATFEAAYTLTDDDELVEAVLTGPFYPDADPVTYTVRFAEYDVEQEITAP